MKQKGEGLIFCILTLVALSGLLLLCTLELKQSFSLLQKRTQLFLCVKETKGELTLYLELMGKTNWAIKNINRLRLITLIIPGLQGVSANASKARKVIQTYQNIKLISYLKSLHSIKLKGCPLDTQLLITPYQLGPYGYKRDTEGVALLRKNEWTYVYFLKPYFLTHKVHLSKIDGPSPTIRQEVVERMGKLSSLLSLR